MEDDVIYAPGGGRAGAGTGTSKKSVMQVWRGERMVRVHSFLASVEQIVRRSYTLDVVKVNIIGDMHAGKTTLAEAIAHAYHTRMKSLYGIPFAVRLLTAKHLAEFEETLKSLAPANYVLIFDDVSFMDAKHSRKQIGAIKNAVTTIRHMGAKDTKITMIYNFHYNLALDKFLRQADFRYWVTVGESEYENMERQLRKPAAMRLVQNFQRWRNSAVNTGTWKTPAGKDGHHVYKYRNPWIPCLFWDGMRLRHVVTPTREWLAPKCPTCHEARGTATSEISPAVFVAEGRKAFGAQTFDAAAKLTLLENGLGTYSRAILAAKRAIDSALHVHAVSLEDIQIECGLTVNKARLRGGYSKFLDGIGILSKEAQLARYESADDKKDEKAGQGPAGPKPQSPKPNPDAAAAAAPPPALPPVPVPVPVPAPRPAGPKTASLKPAAPKPTGTRPPPRIV